MAESCFENGIFLVGLLPSSICCITVMSIAMMSMNAMRKPPTMNKIVQLSFYIACILSIMNSVLGVIASFISNDAHPNESGLSSMLSTFAGGVFFALAFVI